MTDYLEIIKASLETLTAFLVLRQLQEQHKQKKLKPKKTKKNKKGTPRRPVK